MPELLSAIEKFLDSRAIPNISSRTSHKRSGEELNQIGRKKPSDLNQFVERNTKDGISTE